MFNKKSIFCVFSVLLIVLLMSGTLSASARPLQAALGTGFTYQGKLTDGGTPANGTYDLEFKLYDALSSGSQVGSTVTKDDVTVTNGLFTAQLDFGDVFNGTALYLEIGVRPGIDTGAYIALTPRQPLSAAPYASYAAKAPWSGLTGVPAGFADGADDNTTYTAGSGLDLTGGAFSVTGAPWSGLSGIPAGFADGVDNDTTYTAGDGLELVGAQFKGKGTPYQNVVIVAKSGGDFTSIQAALDSITDAGTTNRYLIYIAPGVYTERVTMKQYVDIEGAGELTTKITFTGSTFWNTGTVVGASNAELRFLTVENTGGSAFFAIAIYNSGAAPRLTHVSASATGGTFEFGNGVFNSSSSSPTMTNVTASASGGTSENYGVWNLSSSPTMTNVSASATGGTGTFNSGVRNDADSGTYTVRINNSQISGSSSTIVNDTEFTTLIGASQLSGGAVIGGGTVTCAGVYDENYTFYASTCP